MYNITLTELLDLEMIANNLKHANEMHTAALASLRLCAGASYWATVGFTSPKNSNEQDPIKTASFYKDSRN